MKTKKRKPRGYWTKERCFEEALKYNTKVELENNNSSVYNIILKNKWIKECCAHMTIIHKPKGYWTKERCLEESKKYKNKSELKLKNGSAYHFILKNNWSNECFSHMETQGNRIKRLIYLIIFPDNCVYIGLTYNVLKRFKDHLNNKKSSVYKHMEKTGLVPKIEILTDFLEKNEASKEEGVVEKKYRDEGYVVLNKSKTGTLGGCVVKWTKDACVVELLKYKTKAMFRKKSSGAYNSCVRNGWLDEICLNIIPGKKSNGYWNDINNVCKAVFECKSSSELLKKYRKAYDVLHLEENYELKQKIYKKLGWKFYNTKC